MYECVVQEEHRIITLSETSLDDPGRNKRMGLE
jgi:hypothetical protein